MGKMSEVLAKVNSQMHQGRCPQSGCIGECAAIDETWPGVWWAALYIWDNDFNDSTRVAKWFHDAGAGDVLVSHVLHDSANGDQDGRTFDGVRAWHVQFSMPQNAELTGASASQPSARTQGSAAKERGMLKRLRCWWFGHEQHPQDSAPPESAACMHCGGYVPYGDMVGYTRHNRAMDGLRYWLWRRWLPAKCGACGARYGHRSDCDGIPF